MYRARESGKTSDVVAGAELALEVRGVGLHQRTVGERAADLFLEADQTRHGQVRQRHAHAAASHEGVAHAGHQQYGPNVRLCHGTAEQRGVAVRLQRHLAAHPSLLSHGSQSVSVGAF